MNSKPLATAAAAALIVLSMVVRSDAQAAPQAAPQAPQRGGQAGAAAGQGRGGPGDPFAGQPRIKALIVSGGCCHDYSGEAKVLMDTVSKVLPVDWTVAV